MVGGDSLFDLDDPFHQFRSRHFHILLTHARQITVKLGTAETWIATDVSNVHPSLEIFLWVSSCRGPCNVGVLGLENMNWVVAARLGRR